MGGRGESEIGEGQVMGGEGVRILELEAMGMAPGCVRAGSMVRGAEGRSPELRSGLAG